jgi:hypothetical protein
MTASAELPDPSSKTRGSRFCLQERLLPSGIVLTNVKYIGLDVHEATISIAVRDESGKLIMESVVETRASTILDFIDDLCGKLCVAMEEGVSADWLMRNRSGAFSVERLMDFLIALGQDVEIRVKPARGEQGKVSFVA